MPHKDAQNLIIKFLIPKPLKRLGCINAAGESIQNHPFFKGHVNFDDLYALKIRPPIIPKISNEYDVSNFDDWGDDDRKLIPYVPTGFVVCVVCRWVLSVFVYCV